MKGSHHVPTTKLAVSKDEWHANEETGPSPLRMPCVYCGMPKGISGAKATSNGKNIKPVALAIELR